MKKLALGIRYIFLGVLVGLVIGVLGGIAAAISNPLLGQLIVVAAGAVGYYGTWLLTSPDPSGIGEDPTVSSRKFIRIALLLGIVYQLCSGLIQAGSLPDWLKTIAMVVLGLAGLISVAGQFAQFTYFRTLARRIPDEKLARRANLLRWAYVVPTALAMVVGLVALIGYSQAGPGGVSAMFGGGGGPGGAMAPVVGGILVFLGCGTTIAVIIFGIMTIQLMWTLGKRFKEQAELARVNWAEVRSEPRP